MSGNSVFPTSLDVFTNPNPTDAMDSSAALYHDIQHGLLNDSVKAIELLIGITGSADTTSITNRLNTVMPATQSPNLVWSGPSSGAPALPTFRALVSADIPWSGIPWNIPGAIGATTPNTGSFTTLNVSTTITGNPDIGVNKITALSSVHFTAATPSSTPTSGALVVDYGVGIGGALNVGGAIGVAGQITSTVTTGTAPFSIASTTVVPNLNVSQLLGATWASPGAIGATTPAAGTFTTLYTTSTSTVNTTGNNLGSLNINASTAGTQAGIAFSDGNTAEWSIYKDTDNTLVVYDRINGIGFLRFTPGALGVGNCLFRSTLDATSGTTGAINTAGGIGITKALWVGTTGTFGGILSVTNATASTTPTTGALVVTGGVGINGALNVGGNSTISGNINVNGGVCTFGSTTNAGYVISNGPANSGHGLALQRVNSNRWTLYTDAVAETGSNAGTGLSWAAIADDGSTIIDTPLQIVRAAGGVITLGGNGRQVFFAGGTQTGASIPALNIVQTWNNAAIAFTGIDVNFTDTASAAASLILNLRVSGASQFSVNKSGTAVFNGTISAFGGGTSVFSGNISANGATSTITVGNNTATAPNIILNGAAGNERLIFWQSAGVNRWAMFAENDAEGGNAGSTFKLAAYTDAGAFIDIPFSITRASGGTINLGGSSNRQVNVVANTQSSTTGTGALVVAGGVGIGGKLYVGGQINFSGSTAPVYIVQAAATSLAPGGFTFIGGAHTTLQSGTETVDINFNLARTVQWATSTPATQRAFLVQAPTYSCDTAAQTIATAATLAITGAPVNGTNVTITNKYALWVQAGTARFEGSVATNGGLSVGDGTNIALGTVGGTQIATATTQKLGFWGATPIAQKTGYGTPTGGSLVTNFPGATATLAQTSGTLAQLILDLKAAGIIGA